MEKPDFDSFDTILSNFDAFCDEFESRAAEAFLRGDQNDGKVTRATAEIGTSTPNAVREVTEPGPTDITVGETYIDVSSPGE